MTKRFQQTKEGKNKEPQWFESRFEKADDSTNYPGILGAYEGPIQKKTENENGRVYTEQFWDEFFESEENQQRLEDRLMLGRIMHPDNSVNFDLNYASHVVTGVWDGAEFEGLDNDLIYGRVEVMDTDAGQNLHAMLESGVKLGVSSRSAVVSEERDGKEYITGGSAFGWDIVYQPSVEEAVPEKVESSGVAVPNDPTQLVETVEQAESDNAKVVCEATGIQSESQSKDEPNQTQEENEMSDRSLEDILEDNPEAKQEAKEMAEEIVELEDKVEQLEEEKQKQKKRAGDVFEKQKAKYESAKELLNEKEQELEMVLKTAREKYQEDVQETLDVAKEKYQEDVKRVLDIAREKYQEDMGKAREFYQTKKQKFGAFAEGLKREAQKHKEALEIAREKYQEVKQDSEEQKLEAYAEIQLEQAGESDNDKLKSVLEDAESKGEIDSIISRVEKADKARQEGLPTTEGFDPEAIEQVAQEREQEQNEEAKEIHERVESAGKYL